MLSVISHRQKLSMQVSSVLHDLPVQLEEGWPRRSWQGATHNPAQAEVGHASWECAPSNLGAGRSWPGRSWQCAPSNPEAGRSWPCAFYHPGTGRTLYCIHCPSSNVFSLISVPKYCFFHILNILIVKY